MQKNIFDALIDDNQAGFRLKRFEVYNWGTFNKHVWTLGPNGHNALLTGDIGSGKSTLVDALTTLLVPHQKITYHKAAGAHSKERSLYSYIRGEYKNEKDDLSTSAKAVALRKSGTFSVILGVFHNEAYKQTVTLAQVFWLKEGQRNPDRFYLVAEEELSIKKQFAGFGKEISALKKQLKKLKHTQLFDRFKDYSLYFRRVFGIQSEQALELFYQTVSMKSVGNLTEFVRLHMLAKHNATERIEALKQNFSNLNRAHEAILKAKLQIDLLTPLIENAKKYQQLTEEVSRYSQSRDMLSPYFATIEADLLEKNLIELAQKKNTH